MDFRLINPFISSQKAFCLARLKSFSARCSFLARLVVLSSNRAMVYIQNPEVIRIYDLRGGIVTNRRLVFRSRCSMTVNEIGRPVPFHKLQKFFKSPVSQSLIIVDTKGR